MKIVKTLLIIFLLLSAIKLTAQEETIKLTGPWKFIKGDNLEYAASGFNDSQWKTIRVDAIWESQGYDPYDGYAWYRVKVFIPSSLKDKAYLKDSLKVFLGKINNFDQTFLNGKLIGINGKNVPSNTTITNEFTNAPQALWNYNRRYTLAANNPAIQWDKENVIAVRVFDEGGQGGVYTGDQAVSMTRVSEYLTVDASRIPFTYKSSTIAKIFTLKNIFDKRELKGLFTIEAKNKLNNQVTFSKKEKLTLKPNEAKQFTVELKGQDQANIITYTFEFEGATEKFKALEETPYILTPRPSDKPKINGAKIYGQRPGKPFLYKVAATGKEPLAYDATNLPKGLSIDKKKGIISGVANEKGEYVVAVTVKNKSGTAKENIKFVIGDLLALTPPMGWNSWNCWGLTVDQNKVVASAKVYSEKGLARHGWTYINIDDGWEIAGKATAPKRNADGTIIVNEKFPNMKALGDSIHALGLKFGIYSSPGPLTCGNYTASYQHELQDAKSYASWGVDYLKYDWCSYDGIAKDSSLAERMKPYFVMQDALKKIDRDIVYSLCQYGMSNVWEWGAKVDGNLWRTTEDITDTWQSMSSIGFSQIVNAKWAQPGRWNDPDMLVVGWVGWGPSLHPTNLTPDEQYTHISLWSMLSAPLLIGCDLTRLDEFTLNLLTNDEVLALDQDPLGSQAAPVIKKGDIQVWKKKLADGNYAVGIFNLGKETGSFAFNFSEAGLNGSVKLRDLWRQKDLGSFKDKYEVKVPSHGVVLIKVK
jgi:alpha-galactosidase